MLGLRTIPKEDLKASPAELVFGTTLTVPGDFTPQATNQPVPVHLKQLRQLVDSLKPVPTAMHQAADAKTNVPNRLTDTQFVYVRRDGHIKPLQCPYDGPFQVVEHGPKVFKLQIGSKIDIVSIDRLKVAYTEGEVTVAQLPPRGRPKKQLNNFDPQAAPTTSSNQPPKPGSRQEKTSLKKPTYAEITKRVGRKIKTPLRFT